MSQAPPACCPQVDLTQFGETIEIDRWRQLSTEKKVCAVAVCACAPARQCKGCHVSYCKHHGGWHFHVVTGSATNPPAWTDIPSSAPGEPEASGQKASQP